MAKKQTLFSSALIWVALLKILKRYCHTIGNWSSPSTAYYNYIKKQGSNFTSLVALNFRNNSHCSLLSKLINATRAIFQFFRNENTKYEHSGITRRKIRRKSKKKGWAVLQYLHSRICISVLTNSKTCR